MFSNHTFDRELQLEATACPWCKNVEGIREFSFEPFGVSKCAGCGLYFLTPRLKEAEMMKIYQDPSYFIGTGSGYQDYEGQQKSLRATFRRFLRELKRRVPQAKSLLEVGCGYGFFLDEAKPYFENRVGTDYCLDALERAKLNANKVYHGGLDAVPTGERFDVVVSIQVLEHIYDPKAFLTQCVNATKIGGTVVVATPQMGSFWQKLMGSKWPSFNIPEHVTYFDRHTLAMALNGVGLSEVRKISYPHAFPLPLIASKLRIKLPNFLERFSLWIPETTLAMYGKRH
jgi:2-polyprenyl-3-methyl-5-hydroxy-6-metoxy-1,4-benzoquinol methylase